MRFSQSVVLALPGLALAFPGFLGESRAEMENELRSMMEAEKREAEPQLLGGLIGDLTNTVTGLLGSVAEGLLNPDNKRPEPGYDFIAPKSTDSRGPCPGK